MIMHHRQIRLLNRLQPRIRVRTLKTIKVLHQSDDSIARLSEGILLYRRISFCHHRGKFTPFKNRKSRECEQLTTKTDTRSTIKREVLPPMLGVLFPALGPESTRIRTPEIGAAVHGEDVVGDHCALLHVDGGPAVGTSPDREGGVFGCDAEVDGNGWLEAEDWRVRLVVAIKPSYQV